MEVGGLSSQSVYPLQLQTVQQQDLDAEGSPEDPVPTTEVPETSPIPAEPTDQEAEDGENVRGVLRNMQEGHFKGVSDVRLRINFLDEIAAIERQQLQAVAEEKLGFVLESVGESVTTLLGSEEFTGQYSAVSEFQDAFTHAVNELKQEFIAGGEPSKEDLLTGLKSTFQPLLGSLSTALSTTTTEAQEEGIMPEDNIVEESVAAKPLGDKEDAALEPETTSESESNFQAFIEELKSAFDAALEQLASDLNEVEVLPELSEPKGNGVAYNKFLAIYNELWGIQPDVPSNDSEQFETIA